LEAGPLPITRALLRSKAGSAVSSGDSSTFGSGEGTKSVRGNTFALSDIRLFGVAEGTESNDARVVDERIGTGVGTDVTAGNGSDEPDVVVPAAAVLDAGVDEGVGTGAACFLPRPREFFFFFLACLSLRFGVGVELVPTW
jgi:hypothetical protein